MEQPRLRWRGKMTLYRSAQSQPDLASKRTNSSDKSKLVERHQLMRAASFRNRPHTAEATVRFQEMNSLGIHSKTRPNTAVVLGVEREGSANSSITSKRCDSLGSSSYLSDRKLSGKNQTNSKAFGKQDAIKRVRAQSCKRRSARLDPEERKRIVLTHRQSAEEKVDSYYKQLKQKKMLEADLATKRAVAAKRFKTAIWKVRWIIRWKRAMIAISLDNMVMTAMEMDWHTRNTDASETQFKREDYSRARVSTRVPAWAEKILRKPPDWRTETECNKLHALMRPLKSFEKFTEKIQLAMCRAMRYEFVDAKRIILRKGHPGVCFYFIYSGSAFVNVEDHNSNHQVFTKTAAILHRGESFGELALLRDVTRAATITCREDCELLTVDNEIFGMVCPTIFEQELQEKLVFIRDLPVFVRNMWSEESLQAICSDGQIKQYKNNKVIIADNAHDDWLYICMEGKCKVIRCLTMEPEDELDFQLTSQSCKEDDRSARLFSNIINEGRVGGGRRYSSENEASEAKHQIPKDDTSINKVQMLNSMAVDWFEAHEQSDADIQFLARVEEIRRKNKSNAIDLSNRISGIKTFTILMKELVAKAKKDESEAVFIEIAEMHPKDIFDIYAILRETESNRSGHLILVSLGAKMVRLKRTEFFRRATFEALEYIKTITEDEKYPTEGELLTRYELTHVWQGYREKTLSKSLLNGSSMDMHARLDLTRLHRERQMRNAKLLKTLKFNEQVESNDKHPEETEHQRALFQFEIDRMQQDEDHLTDMDHNPKSSNSQRKRRVSAVGALPNLVEHMILGSKSSPPPSLKIQ